MNRQLRRSTTNKIIGGVAGGIAETFNWDPTLVRLGFVLLTLGHGVGLVLYLALMVIMPKADAITSTPFVGANSEGGSYAAPALTSNRTLGYALVGIGAVILASTLHITGPVLAVLLCVGGWHLLRQR